MILLESHNVIIQNVLTDRFIKPSTVDIVFVDYDSTRFHMSTPESKGSLLLSMSVKCWPDLVKYGALDLLQREYGAYLLPQDQTEPEYNVSLVFDLANVPPAGEERTTLIQSLSHIKRNAFAAPFERAFAEHAKLLANPTPAEDGPPPGGELMTISYRDEEAIYIQAKHDRVTVVFSTVFREETDRIFGKVFLQEFVDARRLPSIQNAPAVLYSNRDPPLEIRHLPGLKQTEDIGYVTFVLFPRHMAPQTKETTITHLQLFRDYLHYHIKCSKAYMHSRMRFRVAEFGKVLNRAKPELPTEKERKTATGRIFRSR